MHVVIENLRSGDDAGTGIRSRENVNVVVVVAADRRRVRLEAAIPIHHIVQIVAGDD